MIENTVYDLIESIKDLSGQTNISTAKAIRALNFGADSYSRLHILNSGKWKEDSNNHENLPRITTTITSADEKVSLPLELIAIQNVEVMTDGRYQPLEHIDAYDSKDASLSTVYATTGVPKRYDYDADNLYLYPQTDSSITLRVTYSRAHPRFSVDELTQSTGVVPIDDEYLVMYAVKYVMTGSNDPSIVGIKQDLQGMRNDVVVMYQNRNQNSVRRIKPKISNAFSKR